MTEEWSLEQAIGWVIWRDEDTVKNLDRGALFSFMIYPTMRLPPDEREFGDRHEELKALHNKHKKLLRRQGMLLSALREGSIACRGSKNGTEDKKPIDAALWRDLTFRISHNEVPHAVPKGAGETIWVDITFNADEVRKLFLQDGSTKQKRKQGRKKGDGEIDDSHWIEKMNGLIQSEKVNSPHAAALTVIDGNDDVKGTSRDSKARRLTKKYRQKYPA